ncbi:MAG: cobalamin-binding protein [Pyrinomonadaceae bacterium]|nr:cobalamin-binding protein [Pyrinomonadaceae bacterium]
MFNDLAGYPRRIICLTEETTETLYLLGEGERIVGISGYTVRPAEARQKPKVSAFINAKFDKIMSLKPDLVFAFSDLQADIAAELIRRGVTVFTFNQRGVNEVLEMILTVGRIVGVENKAVELVETMRNELNEIAESAKNFPLRPRVYFEEWFDPLISGIRWVEELIEIAGGEPIFPELKQFQGAKDRIIDSQKVIKANPQVIIGSWCGKALKKNLVRSREGWEKIEAVQNNHIYEVKSAYILQPGPASLTEGIRQIHKILAKTAGVEIAATLQPLEKTDPDLN